MQPAFPRTPPPPPPYSSSATKAKLRGAGSAPGPVRAARLATPPTVSPFARARASRKRAPALLRPPPASLAAWAASGAASGAASSADGGGGGGGDDDDGGGGGGGNGSGGLAPGTSSSKRHAPSAESPPGPPPSARLVQTYLDLGQSRFDATTCGKCGMVYAPGLEDQLHAKACEEAARAAQQALPWPARASDERCGSDQDVVVVRLRDAARDARVARVLRAVDEALGFALPAPAERGANSAADGRDEGAGVGAAAAHVEPGERSAFISVRGGVAVGCMVTEPVAAACAKRRVSGASEPAALGVLKLWVHPAHRRRGVGAALVSAARSHFGYPMPLPLERVAMSSPTEAGAKWAERCLGSDFLVYT